MIVSQFGRLVIISFTEHPYCLIPFWDFLYWPYICCVTLRPRVCLNTVGYVWLPLGHQGGDQRPLGGAQPPVGRGREGGERRGGVLLSSTHFPLPILRDPPPQSPSPPPQPRPREQQQQQEKEKEEEEEPQQQEEKPQQGEEPQQVKQEVLVLVVHFGLRLAELQLCTLLTGSPARRSPAPTTTGRRRRRSDPGAPKGSKVKNEWTDFHLCFFWGGKTIKSFEKKNICLSRILFLDRSRPPALL